MAPAQQNVNVCDEMDSHFKMRLIPDGHKSENGVTCYENNNTVLQGSANEKTKSETDFDISKYEAMEFRPRIKWPDLTVQVLLHLVTIYGLYLIITFQAKFLTVLFAFGTIYTSGFGITAGVHRLWSHRAYKANMSLRILLALLFTITGQLEGVAMGSPVSPVVADIFMEDFEETALNTAPVLPRFYKRYVDYTFTILPSDKRDIYTWALDHRVHHKYSESVADPHDVRRGFWFAHVGWLVLTPHPAVEDRRIALRKTSVDLMADPVVRIQKKFFIPLFALLNIILPVGIPLYFWGETLFNSFVVSFVTRFTITLNIAFCVNSFAHLWGNKPYDRYIKPVENSVVSLAALGEGWHNYHHVFPWDYRTSELGRLNISTNFIDIFSRIGWAYDLKAATPAMIVNRAKRSGDGTLGEDEEPEPTSTNISHTD